MRKEDHHELAAPALGGIARGSQDSLDHSQVRVETRPVLTHVRRGAGLHDQRRGGEAIAD